MELPQAWLDELGASEDDVDSIAGFARAIEGVELGITVRDVEGGNGKLSLLKAFAPSVRELPQQIFLQGCPLLLRQGFSQAYGGASPELPIPQLHGGNGAQNLFLHAFFLRIVKIADQVPAVPRVGAVYRALNDFRIFRQIKSVPKLRFLIFSVAVQISRQRGIQLPDELCMFDISASFSARKGRPAAGGLSLFLCEIRVIAALPLR